MAAFLSTEAYLVLALADLAGFGVATAGFAVSTGALSWSAGSFLQARLDAHDGGRRRRSRAVAGITILAASVALLAAMAGAGALPLLPALALWVLAGLRMGLAHSVSGAMAFALAPEGEEGSVSSSLLLADLFGPAVSIGVGGALLSLGRSSQGGWELGVALALGIGPPLLVLALFSALRLPRGPGP